MIDREKVIKKLAVRIQSDSEEWNTIELPIEEANDILALMKEQEEEIENLKQTCQSMMEGVCLLKEQEAKTGEWIPVTNSRGGMECSICHDYAPSYQNGTEYLSKYCPYCGAKMEGR